MSVVRAMPGIAARRSAHQRAELGDGVAAPHALEHGVGARLQRQVDVLADLGLSAIAAITSGGEVERVGRGEADALDARRRAATARSSSAKPTSS